MFDHEFSPWRECDGTRVVAAESQWKAVEKWNREAARCVDCGKDKKTCGHYHARPRVFLGSLMDVFEDWQGPMVNAKGEPLLIHADKCGWNAGSTSYPTGETCCKCGGWANRLKMADVRARLFRLIDACPHLTFIRDPSRR